MRYIISSFVIALASMCVAPLLQAAQADLVITKRVKTQPSGVFPADFDVVVTNYGPDAAGAVTITDTLAPGAFFDIFLFVNPPPAPWVCTFTPSGQPTSVSCTHPGPIPVGTSVSLPVSVVAGKGRYENCAQVMHAVGSNSDPDATNDRDCACTDFKACRDISVDLSTGTRGSQQMTVGDSDDDWVVVATPQGPAGNLPAKVVGKTHAGFVDALPANWISATNPHATPFGDYIYDLNFTLGNERYLTCIVGLEYASDNDVQFLLDGQLIAQTVNADTSAFTQLHSKLVFGPSAGPHTLRAHVNNEGGPTSLLVHGSLFCSCNTFIDFRSDAAILKARP
jgi:Domain of unknown function DUF11